MIACKTDKVKEEKKD